MANWFLISVVFFLGLWTKSGARDLEWWEDAFIYQVYPRSFMDSNGDGIGDLKGITEKLDYIKDLGVEAIWIQPFYESPMDDMGYDVANYKSVDPMFGTMEDFKQMVRGIHNRGMKVILDFVPNHVSDQHEWFKLSERRVDPYTDYFIWQDPKIDRNGRRTYPNNWRSVFSGSAWKWSEKRKQYYFHQFGETQVDLNFRNPKVREELNSVLRFWLDLGADGFRVDAILYFIEADHLRDEPVIPTDQQNDWWTLNHIYTKGLLENREVTHQWRELLLEYERKDGKKRLLCTEDSSRPEELVKFIGNDTYPNVQIPFYFGLTNFVDDRFNATMWKAAIQDWVSVLPLDTLPNWILDSHDTYRVSARLDVDSVDSQNMLCLLLPGTLNLYYGSEIGLPESKVRPDQRKDIFKDNTLRTDPRDACRGPMIWDDTKNAGFTTNQSPWLPVTAQYWKLNVKRQLQEPNSHLNTFKRLVNLRNTLVIKKGDLQSYVLSKWSLMIIRNLTTKSGADTIAVVLNLGTESEEICAKNSQSALPDTMFVHTSSQNSGFNIGDPIKISNADGKMCTELRPRAGLVLTTNHGVCLSCSFYLILLASCANLLRKMH